MVNRKLIRPSLSEIKDQMPRYGPVPRKRVPPEVTNAENYYYIKQMAAKTPMIVKLTDGEEIRESSNGTTRTASKCTAVMGRIF